jgi:hypothetical protein
MARGVFEEEKERVSDGLLSFNMNSKKQLN